MSYVVVCTVAFLASGLTFFSGFGLGTLLLPAFALFFAIDLAVALTAVVHFLNGVFKLFLVWRHIDWAVVRRFGITAIAGALAGAWCLLHLAGAAPIASYSFLGRAVEIAPAKAVVGALLLVFAFAEVWPGFRRLSFAPRHLPWGGLASGFFGGLSGTQGALRAAFLVRAGLSKEAYVATGAAVAFLIDVSRLSVYAELIFRHRAELDYPMVAGAVACAWLGATLGNRLLRKATLAGIRNLVAAMLLLVALGLMSGLL